MTQSVIGSSPPCQPYGTIHGSYVTFHRLCRLGTVPAARLATGDACTAKPAKSCGVANSKFMPTLIRKPCWPMYVLALLPIAECGKGDSVRHVSHASVNVHWP
ncbi:hypothetical protein K437DRAFT_258414 [Tilletiaria anomala UBC 951]|uniref:Uncharacterized protein n=1 Tax=Tilletiaria anomala (strain ATCC 24038 / CBS 436.72 / UBC 951) TaxID=1037660 RepID=A0A066VR47_TILAU|nr:uncharacterized protein K437DRAFT_258414 [Tilletiaria anomala UBC 951]KDN41060.1 hypothetical protein K437DRAFT_258414 [Tilletiaria anomala UBC 951]